MALPDPNRSAGHTWITLRAVDILNERGLAPKRLGAPLPGTTLLAPDLLAYGATWADHPFIGRPEDPSGVVWNPGANASFVASDANGVPQTYFNTVVGGLSQNWTFKSGNYAYADDTNWNSGANLSEKIEGIWWLGGPVPNESDGSWNLSRPNVYSRAKFNASANFTSAGALSLFGIGLVGIAHDINLANLGDSQSYDFAVDNLYHYSHNDVLSLSNLPANVGPDVILYPITSGDCGGYPAISSAAADDFRWQKPIAGAGYGAETYGSILYQMARKFFVGSPGAPTLYDLVPAGNVPMPPQWVNGREQFPTGAMKGVNNFSSLYLPLPSTWLGGMPFICSGGSDANDPCKDGNPVWPIWVPDTYDPADLVQFQTKLLNPTPAQSDTVAWIYLGWALHLIEDLSLPHHAANWTGKEHINQDNCGDKIQIWWPEKVQAFNDSVDVQLDALLGPPEAPKSRSEICDSSFGLDAGSVPASGLGWENVRAAYLSTAQTALPNLSEAIGNIDAIYKPCTGGSSTTLCVYTQHADFPAACAAFISNAVVSAVRMLYCAAPEDPKPPEAPGGLAASPNNGEAFLTWIPSLQPGVTYQVAQCPLGGNCVDGCSNVVCANGTGPYCDIQGLENNTTYQFSVIAQNGAGASAPACVTVTPAVYVPDPPSSGVSAVASDASVTVSWGPPGWVQWAVYVAYEMLTADGKQLSDWSRYTTGDTTYVFDGLTNGTRYAFRVATIDEGIEGPPSDTVYATPLPPVPEPPANLVANASNGYVQLSWDPSNGAVSYQVWQVDPDSSSPDGVRVTLIGSTTDNVAIAPDLIDGTTYGFYVLAVNLAGASGPSNYVTTMPRSTPGTPFLTAYTATSGEIDLSWTQDPFADWYIISQLYPDGTGGYTWDYIAELPASETSFVVSGLTDGEFYYFDMHAVNKLGWGTASNLIGPASPSYVNGPADQPNGLVAVGANRRATLTWNPVPAADMYSVRIATSADGPFTEVGKTPSVSFVMKGLVNGTTYYFVVASISSGNMTQPFAAPVLVVPSVTECQNDTVCSGHGSCNSGDCRCQSGYAGADCSISCPNGGPCEWNGICQGGTATLTSTKIMTTPGLTATVTTTTTTTGTMTVSGTTTGTATQTSTGSALVTTSQTEIQTSTQTGTSTHTQTLTYTQTQTATGSVSTQTATARYLLVSGTGLGTITLRNDYVPAQTQLWTATLTRADTAGTTFTQTGTASGSYIDSGKTYTGSGTTTSTMEFSGFATSTTTQTVAANYSGAVSKTKVATGTGTGWNGSITWTYSKTSTGSHVMTVTKTQTEVVTATTASTATSTVTVTGTLTVPTTVTSTLTVTNPTNSTQSVTSTRTRTIPGTGTQSTTLTLSYSALVTATATCTAGGTATALGAGS